LEKKFQFRWRFSTIHGPDIVGIWDTDHNLTASDVVKFAVEEISIDTRNMETEEESVLVTSYVTDFQEFQWIAEAKANVFGFEGRQTMTPTTIGCKLITKDEIFTALSSGKMKVEKRV